MTFLTVIVVLPIAALVWRASADGAAVVLGLSDQPPRRSLRSSSPWRASLVVVLLNAVLGTVTGVGPRPGRLRREAGDERDHRPAVRLPTIVAGLTLLALYGPRSPIGIDVAYTRQPSCSP